MSEASPFLHAPGMPNCASACAAVTFTGGTGIIMRGGDTWHYNASTPLIGGSWRMDNFSGTVTNCQLNELSGAIVKTSCLYFGVDLTWYSGGSFARPIITQDNPLSTNYVTCTYNGDAFNGVFMGAYTITDNIDWQGECTGVNPNAAYITVDGLGSGFYNDYFHGWTIDANGGSPVDDYNQIRGGGTNSWIFDHSIVDGADSTDGTYTNTAAGYATGIGISGASVASFSIFRHVVNGCSDCGISIHDSRFEYMFNGGSMGGGNHGNISSTIACMGITDGPPCGSTMWVYNNTVDHDGEGVGITVWVADGGTGYFFNNVCYDNTNAGIWMPGPKVSGVDTYIVTNNTIGDNTCAIGSNSSTSSNTVYTFENNHLIDWTSLSTNAPSWSTNVAGNIFQTTANATTQGYVVANNYQPTSSSGVTYHAGTNLSTGCTSPYSFDGDLCSGSTAGETSTPGTGVLSGLVVAQPTPVRGSTWDSGAYQFSGSAPAGSSSTSGGAKVSGGAKISQMVNPGDWQGRYGTDGYSIPLGPASLPSYASLSLSGAQTWNWNGASDPRALSLPASGRLASCWYSGTPWNFTVNVTDGNTHQFTVYALDFDSTTRKETFTLTNPAGTVLNTQSIANFNAGIYVSWLISGTVKFAVTSQGGANSVISAALFN